VSQKNKPLKIDMCAGSELKDTQGETLSIEGADISELQAGAEFQRYIFSMNIS